MAFRGVARIGLGVMVALAAACGGSEPAAPPPASSEPLFKPVDPSVAPVVPQPGPNTVTLPPATLPDGSRLQPMAMVTDMASGWPVTLQVGQGMTARLTANRASGERWSLRAGSDAGILAMEGEPRYEEPAGSASVEVFQLKATKAGRATLTFDLKKGSDQAPLRTVSYPVTVQ